MECFLLWNALNLMVSGKFMPNLLKSVKTVPIIDKVQGKHSLWNTIAYTLSNEDL